MCSKQVGEAQRVRKQIEMFFVTAALCLFFPLFFNFVVSLDGIRYGSHPGIDTVIPPKKRQKANMSSNSELSMKVYSVNTALAIKITSCC